MAVFKCKMCGGDLNIVGNERVAECEYCGTKQTLPTFNLEQKEQLYLRAGELRRADEFDGARAVYEQILALDPDDAEAYWSIVLCNYGIEYVEDPVTKHRVPTVNRTQFAPIFSDVYYKSAIEHADAVQRAIYENEAKAIDEIQKEILVISENEEPFDVFICYKETDHAGRRTEDSVIATDLYNELTREGYKVFFARISLEDKLGSAYEPYIFAALNSAKVMVVLGTRPEYFTAPWVKNEWSRFLAFIKDGQRKTLIPAFKNMSAYDLPEEFSFLQSQDMSKIGFMQDIVRGIGKLVGNGTHESKKSSAAVDTLLKRGFLSLEDSEWTAADEFFEQALNIDPELSEAYLGKLMCERMVSKREDLAHCRNPLDESGNYTKAIRFADGELADLLIDANDSINKRNDAVYKEEGYDAATRLMNMADSEEEFSEAEKRFRSLGNYKDAAVLAERCAVLADGSKKNEVYTEAYGRMTNGERAGAPSELLKAIELFDSIPGYKDADVLQKRCRTALVELSGRLEQAQSKRKAEFKKQKSRKSTFGVLSGIFGGILFIFYIIFKFFF